MRFLRELLTFASVFGGISAKIYNPCEVASEILNAKVPKMGKPGELEPLMCSPRDIGRLVCVASLHNFDSEYKYTSGNDSFVGIFGIPQKRSTNVSSIVASQQDFVAYQIYLRMKKMTAVSEVICNYYQWFMDNYLAVLKFWNATDNPAKLGEIWNKRDVNCQDYHLRVFVADEKFSKNYYKPGAVDDFTIKKSNGSRNESKWSVATSNSTDDDDFYEKPCHGEFYCGDFARCSRESSNRVDKSRMERKVERFVKIVDWTIIVLWFIAVVGGLSGGYWYMRQPRRRGRHNDDWGRPILTAHFNS